MVMPAYLGGDSWGSPQGQFEIPAGLVAATPSFAMVASRYMATYGTSEETLAKVEKQLNGDILTVRTDKTKITVFKEPMVRFNFVNSACVCVKVCSSSLRSATIVASFTPNSTFSKRNSSHRFSLICNVCFKPSVIPADCESLSCNRSFK